MLYTLKRTKELVQKEVGRLGNGLGITMRFLHEKGKAFVSKMKYRVENCNDRN